MNIFTSNQLAEQMHEVAEPALAQIHTSGIMQLEDAPGGSGIYYDKYATENAVSCVVISHGFSETAEKFKEMIYYLVSNGYMVYAIDHRGHGRSYRLSSHPCLVHVKHFYDYVEDLHRFVTTVVQAETDLPRYLIGHSMGGAVSATIIEKYPDDFSKAVLSSPMVKLLFPMPTFAVRLISGFMCAIGRSNTFGPGQHPYQGYESFEESASMNEARFDYYQAKKASTKEFQLSAFSYGWLYTSVRTIAKTRSLKECSKITIPVLVFRSGHDTLIDPSGIDEFVKNTPSARLVDVENSRHEIFNSDDEVTAAYYETIFEFFKS